MPRFFDRAGLGLGEQNQPSAISHAKIPRESIQLGRLGLRAAAGECEPVSHYAFWTHTLGGEYP